MRRLREATSGEFEIIREIGRGGMAAVYLAHERVLDRYVAMKIMSPALLDGFDMVQRFQREARTVAKLVHPHIITIHTVRQIDDLHFFTMHFVEGRSLDHIVASAGQLPLPMVRGLLFSVGNALAFAHRRGVVHRDIKPANILVSTDGVAIVTDFGIAKVAEDSPSKTQTNTIIGTPAYISPEQCAGHPATAASDQYSLGIVAFELLTGATPFAGSSFSLMQAHTEGAVPSLRALRPDCPPQVEAAVLRMLAKQPSARWATVQQALAELGAAPLVDGDPMHRALIDLASSSTDQTPPRGPSAYSPVPSLAPTSDDIVTPDPTALFIMGVPTDVCVGEQFHLSAMAIDAHGYQVQRDITWNAEPPGILAIDSDGTARALAPGEVTIHARANSNEDALMLRVVQAAAASPIVAASLTVEPTVEPMVEAPAVAERRSVPWTRIALATAGALGLVAVSAWWLLGSRGQDLGNTTKTTAETEGIKIEQTGGAPVVAPSATPAPIVDVPESRPAKSMPDPVASTKAAVPVPPSLQVTPLSESLHVYRTVVLSAATAGGPPGKTPAVAWSTNAASVATVDERGLVTGVGEGIATIGARWRGVTASAQMIVTRAAVASVAATPATAQIAEGEQVHLQANVRDERGIPLASREIAWRSESPDVASIDNGGIVTGKRAGAAAIIASSERQTGRAVVTVLAKAPVSTPTSSNSAPPPSTPDRASLDRLASTRLSEFVTAINSSKVADLKPTIAPSNWSRFETLMARRDLQAGAARDLDEEVSENSATVEFKTSLTWQTGIRIARRGEAVFRAVFVVRSGAWALQSIQILKTPD
ncbi:MAG TPA: protein kinase [Gemmatimonadaceae bacterium]